MADRGPSPARPVARLLSLEDRHADTAFPVLRRRVLRGAPDAWRRFVERYSRTVYAFALRQSAGEREREEMAQQVYLAVFERLTQNDYRVLRSFRRHARFETYLFVMVRNEALQLRRRGSQQDRRHLSFEEASAADGDRELPADRGSGFAGSIGLNHERVVNIVSESLQRLGPQERLVLRLRFREGLSYRRLAQVFRWKDTNAAAYEVRKILHKLDLLERCRKKLRWSEPEEEVLLRCLRRWLDIEHGSEGPSASDGGGG